MREYALVFLAAATVTWLLTPVARRLATRLGAVAAVRDRDVHAVPTPRWGGLALYAGVLGGLLVAKHLPVLSGVAGGGYDEPLAVVAAGGLVVLLGVVDDRWPLDPLTKLAGQIVAAGTMVLLGVRLGYLSFPWSGRSTIALTTDVAVPLTVLLVVLLVNAVNFIDGLDGLAAGVVAIAAASQFTFSYTLAADKGLLRAQPGALVAALTVGACVGFLPHNFSPARLFMGDSGSMLLGLLLATSTVSTSGQIDFVGATDKSLQLSLNFLVPLLVPVLVLAVPFVDLVLAVVRRTRSGRSPFAPDKMHLHHRLLEIGHSQRRAVLLMYAWAALIGFGGVVVSVSSGPAVPLMLVAALAVVVLVATSLPRLRALR